MRIICLCLHPGKECYKLEVQNDNAYLVKIEYLIIIKHAASFSAIMSRTSIVYPLVSF